MLKKLPFVLLFYGFKKIGNACAMSCSQASFVSNLFFPFKCLLELKWFFTLLLFKHSSSGQPLHNSLLLGTARGSFGYFATRFSCLIVFRPLSVAAPQLLHFPLGGWFVSCDFSLARQVKTGEALATCSTATYPRLNVRVRVLFFTLGALA